MTHVAVKSSNIATIAYEPKEQTLRIKFHSGAVHDYLKVPSTLHADLLKAKSVGSFFHTKIKDKFRSQPVALPL